MDERRVYSIQPGRSGVAVRARSNVGPITFVSADVAGSIEMAVQGDGVALDPSGRLTMSLDTLRSGNQLYDAELLRRLDARRFPDVELLLEAAQPVAGTDRYHLAGSLTVHGVTREIDGLVVADLTKPGTVVVDGEHLIDVRDFDISIPKMLMLTIYPQVRVEMHLEAIVD